MKVRKAYALFKDRKDALEDIGWGCDERKGPRSGATELELCGEIDRFVQPLTYLVAAIQAALRQAVHQGSANLEIFRTEGERWERGN